MEDKKKVKHLEGEVLRLRRILRENDICLEGQVSRTSTDDFASVDNEDKDSNESRCEDCFRLAAEINEQKAQLSNQKDTIALLEKELFLTRKKADDIDSTCDQLISQYKSILKEIQDEVSSMEGYFLESKGENHDKTNVNLVVSRLRVLHMFWNDERSHQSTKYDEESDVHLSGVDPEVETPQDYQKEEHHQEEGPQKDAHNDLTPYVPDIKSLTDTMEQPAGDDQSIAVIPLEFVMQVQRLHWVEDCFYWGKEMEVLVTDQEEDAAEIIMDMAEQLNVELQRSQLSIKLASDFEMEELMGRNGDSCLRSPGHKLYTRRKDFSAGPILQNKNGELYIVTCGHCVSHNETVYWDYECTEVAGVCVQNYEHEGEDTAFIKITQESNGQMPDVPQMVSGEISGLFDPKLDGVTYKCYAKVYFSIVAHKIEEVLSRGMNKDCTPQECIGDLHCIARECSTNNHKLNVMTEMCPCSSAMNMETETVNIEKLEYLSLSMQALKTNNLEKLISSGKQLLKRGPDHVVYGKLGVRSSNFDIMMDANNHPNTCNPGDSGSAICLKKEPEGPEVTRLGLPLLGITFGRKVLKKPEPYTYLLGTFIERPLWMMYYKQRVFLSDIDND